MGNKFFNVLDKLTGSQQIVAASTKRKAEKFISADRFVAEKASPDDVTAFVNAGGKILTVDEHPVAAVVPTVEAEGTPVVQAE